MKTFTVKMNDDDNLRLKRAQYEKDSIADLIARNMNEVPSQFWIDKLTDVNIALEECKQEMVNKYIAPQVTPQELKKTSWEANFNNQEFEVTVND